MAVIIAPERSIILRAGGKSFNPGLAYKDGKRYIVWRKGWRCAEIWGGELDADCNIVESRRILGRKQGTTDGFEDPRLFEHNGSLWLAYTRLCSDGVFQAVASLDASLIVREEWIFKGNSTRKEKNWQFFSSAQHLQAIYRILPHTVGRVYCDEFVLSPPERQGLKWHWGQPRGGTPPVRVGDEFFSFFHSSIKYHYVAAPYAFSAAPPFAITRWPKTHLLIAQQDFMPPDSPHVVFPSGALFCSGVWTISYGWHDRFCCLVEISHDEVLATLETINSEPIQIQKKMPQKKAPGLGKFDIVRSQPAISTIRSAENSLYENGL